MRNEILILRNEPRENPGLIEIVLKENNLEYTILDFSAETRFSDTDKFSAVIVLGGPESANDQTPKMLSELAFIKTAIDSGIPYLGICLGLQTLVKAMGGTIEKCKIPETGTRDPGGSLFRITLTEDGKSDRLLANLPGTINVFQLHGDTVRITSEMKLLGTGDFCPDQIVRVGEKAYGIQFHFELTDELLQSWMKEDPDLNRLDNDALLNDFRLLKPVYHLTGRQIIHNFLFIAGLIQSDNRFISIK